jgi:L-aminopeptidase/D-esterase-like protein
MDLTLASIRGVKVGHAEDREAHSGTTVVLFDSPSVTACEARGGWPGTYDTHSVDVGKAFYQKQAIFLTGGDIFGLDAATGIRKFLLEKKMATMKAGEMPAIVGANIYDLAFAKKSVENISYTDLGYNACTTASSKPIEQGNVGAGIGATVGKLRSKGFCWKGGTGSAAVRILNDIVVGAIVVTNSIGNIFDPSTGKTIAGTRLTRDDKANFCELADIIPEYLHKSEKTKEEKESYAEVKATTIGVVVTNVALNHEQTIKVAQMAHDGLARAIRPVHAMTDGDTLFAVSTGEVEFGGGHSLVDVVGEVSAQQVSKAVLNSVRYAAFLGGVPGLYKGRTH